MWSDEYALAQNVLRRYPQNLRALNILMSQQFEEGRYQDLTALRSLPDQIARELGEEGSSNQRRKHRAGKSYVNYITCQFFIVQGLIKVGEPEEALRRADLMFVDVLQRLPQQNHPCVFSSALAKINSAKLEGSGMTSRVRPLRIGLRSVPTAAFRNCTFYELPEATSS